MKHFCWQFEVAGGDYLRDRFTKITFFAIARTKKFASPRKRLHSSGSRRCSSSLWERVASAFFHGAVVNLLLSPLKKTQVKIWLRKLCKDMPLGLPLANSWEVGIMSPLNQNTAWLMTIVPFLLGVSNCSMASCDQVYGNWSKEDFEYSTSGHDSRPRRSKQIRKGTTPRPQHDSEGRILQNIAI